MKNLAAFSLLTISLLQLASFQPIKAFGKNTGEKTRACVEACRAFIDQPGFELRVCVARCQQPEQSVQN